MKKGDISESGKLLKLSTEYLSESEELFRSLFDNSMDAILLTGTDGSIFSANPSACQMFGWSEEEICRLGRNSLVDNSDPRLNAGLLLRKKKGSAFGELTLIRKNGESFPAEISTKLFRDPSGNERTSMIIRDISERKKSEMNLLLQSEILKNISEGINLIRLSDKTIVFTNPGFDRMFGYEPGEVLGKDVSILNAPADKSSEEIKQDIFNTIHSDGIWQGEILNIKKNGEQFWCSANVTLFDHVSYGKVCLSVYSDITLKKYTELKMRKSEEEFRNLFENSMMGISQADSEGNFLRINKAYAEMYGYPDTITMLNEIKGNSLVLYSNPDDRRRVLDILQEKGSIAPQEFMLRRRNGEYFWALVGAKQIMDNSGNLLYLQAEHIDINERKNLEKAIQQVSIYTRNLIEVSIDSLLTLSIDGKITDVNLATEEITGIKRKKLIGSDITKYFTEPDEVRKCNEAVLKNGLIKDFPLKIVHKNGSSTDVLINATLFMNEPGEVQGIFAAARDITVQKKIEEELRNSKGLLERLNQHQNEIRENERAMISREVHDQLGQSMSALKLDLFMLKKYMNKNPEALIKLESMIALISDTIQTVQRISSDLRPGILDDLGLVAAIEWYCDEFEKRTGIQCSHELDDCDFSDTRISLTFFRVLQESLTNVIRHSGASAVSVKLHNSGKGTTLTILDNGIGITKEKIESYTSLGLINIRERVRQFNGKATILSKKGEGTKVTVFIPS